MTPPIPDAAARQQALSAADSFIVQAPAGSGKTELLTQRALVLLAGVQAPEEVVAVTFTRKAAAEMRHRIHDALLQATGPAPEAAHARVSWELARAVLKRDIEMSWDLLASPSRLRVMTYDALCGHLTRQSPVLAGLSPGHRVADDAQSLYLDAALATLAHAESDDQYAGAVLATLRHFDGNAQRVAQQIVQMLQRRDQWLPLVSGEHGSDARAGLERTMQAVRRRTLSALNAALGAARTQALFELADYALAQLQASRPEQEITERHADSVEDLQRDADGWEFIVGRLLLTSSDTLRKPGGINVKAGFPAAKDGPPEADRRKQQIKALLTELDAEPGLLSLLLEFRRLPAERFEDRQWEMLRELLMSLRLAAAELKLACARHGQVDFIEVAACANEALGTAEHPSELALKFDYRIQHLLLDEFQDTSQPQFELIARLTAGWQPGDGRTLFAVGDPMQSIYRFRQADVRLFLQAWQHGIGDIAMQPLRLQSNFRSVPAIVDWVNTAFDGNVGGAFPQRSDAISGAVEYAPSSSARAPLTHAGVRVHASADDQHSLEAQQLAQVIAEESLENPGASIAVLVRGRGHLLRILPALRQAGIAFQAVELDRLADRFEAQDLRALARALAHPLDRVSWFSVLRAPWAGLSLADLLQLADAVPPRDSIGDWLRIGDFEALSEAGQAIASRLRAALVPSLKARGQLPFAQLVESAWLALGGASVHRGGEVAVDAFMDLLESHCPNGELVDFAALDRALGDTKVSDRADADCRVQVLTMHKSKGLQFDVVLLPGLDRGPGRSDNPAVIWTSVYGDGERIEPLLAPVHAVGNEKDPTYDHARGVEAKREELERCRLMYVAVTRARDRLHLFVSLKPGKDGIGWKEPARGSLAALIWPAISADCVPALTATPDMVEPMVSSIRRLPTDWQLPEWPQGLHSVPMAPAADAAVPFDWAGSAARAIGNVFHRLAQALIEHPEQPRQLRALLPALQQALRAEGLVADELAEAMSRMQAGVRELLDSERGQWLLQPHAEGGCEIELSGLLGQGVSHRIVDRSFVDADGVRWIVDYKTGFREGGDTEAFLDNEQLRYEAQLNAYAQLYRALEPRPIRCALYFPMMGAWREWAAEGS